MTSVLSVAVAAKGLTDPLPFLEALREQKSASAIEFDVHIAHDGCWPAEIRGHDSVAVHQCPTGTSITKLWGTSLTHAKSEYVAVLDINCPPARSWLAEAESCIRDGLVFAWGPVIPMRRAPMLTMIAYLAEYCQFHPPVSRSHEEIPGNNVVFRREFLDSEEKLRSRGFEKTFMVWRLAREGAEFVLQEGMVVEFRKVYRLRAYLQRRAMHGRCFGARRLQQPGQPSRVFCLLSVPAVPLLRMWRIFVAARRYKYLRRNYFRHFLGLLMSEIAWSWGEFLGYSLGAGDSCDRLT